MPYFSYVFYIVFHCLRFEWCSFNYIITLQSVLLDSDLIAPCWRIRTSSCLAQ